MHDIEDEKHNTTRFVVLASEPDDAKPGDGPIVTTFLFRVRNVPAALYKAMGGFATNGVNMTKLESYQLDGRFVATMFYRRHRRPPRRPAGGARARGAGVLLHRAQDPRRLPGEPLPRRGQQGRRRRLRAAARASNHPRRLRAAPAPCSENAREVRGHGGRSGMSETQFAALLRTVRDQCSPALWIPARDRFEVTAGLYSLPESCTAEQEGGPTAMKRSVLLLAALAAAVMFLPAQARAQSGQWEYRVIGYTYDGSPRYARVYCRDDGHCYRPRR